MNFIDFLKKSKNMLEGEKEPKSYFEFKERGLSFNFSYLKEKMLEGSLNMLSSDGYLSSLYEEFVSTRGSHAGIPNLYMRVGTQQFSQLRDFVRELNDIYPDSWDIESAYDPETGQVVLTGFVVHFPKIRLVNAQGGSHILRDVYAKLPISLPRTEGKFFIHSLMLGRSTQTEEEVRVGYFHSHVSEGNFTRSAEYKLGVGAPLAYFYRPMCLGDSSQGILRSISMYNNTSTPSQSTIRELLLGIRSTVRYESLEGGPYKRIADCFNQRSNQGNLRDYKLVKPRVSVNSSYFEKEVKILLLHTLKNNPNFSFNFDVKSHPFLHKKVDLQDNLKLKKALIEAYKDLCSKVENPNDTIVVKDESSNRQYQTSLVKLSKLFTFNSSEGEVEVNPYYFFLPEESATPEVSESVTSSRSSISQYFRKEAVIYRTIRVGTTNTSQNLKKMSYRDLGMQLHEPIFKSIKTYLTNKITKHVFQK